MHGTGLSCSLGRIFHGVGCTVCVCVWYRIKYWPWLFSVYHEIIYIYFFNFTYPLRCLRVPPGVRLPQVEYHCFTPSWFTVKHIGKRYPLPMGKIKHLLYTKPSSTYFDCLTSDSLHKDVVHNLNISKPQVTLYQCLLLPQTCDFSDMIFEVLTAVSVNITVFRNVTPCCLVDGYLRFERNVMLPSLVSFLIPWKCGR